MVALTCHIQNGIVDIGSGALQPLVCWGQHFRYPGVQVMGKVIAVALVAFSLYGCTGQPMTGDQLQALSAFTGAMGNTMAQPWQQQPAYVPPAPPTHTTCQRTTMGLQCITR